MCVCDPRLDILNIVVRHSESTHDSVIFNRSPVRTRLELQQIPGPLLGDNGYACQNYLLTPVLNYVARLSGDIIMHIYAQEILWKDFQLLFYLKNNQQVLTPFLPFAYDVYEVPAVVMDIPYFFARNSC